MSWYQRLNDYFPASEMKKKEQLEALVHKNKHYKLEDTDQYTLLYGEYDDFIFIDYFLVHPQTRGQGVGSEIIESLKQTNKTILLEVEPVDETDPITVKRDRFYRRNGFKKAANIQYYRDSGQSSPKYFPLEIYYWSPHPVSEKQIQQQAIHAYEDIHYFQYDQYYDRNKLPPEQLVRWDASADTHERDTKQREQEDIK